MINVKWDKSELKAYNGIILDKKKTAIDAFKTRKQVIFDEAITRNATTHDVKNGKRTENKEHKRNKTMSHTFNSVY